METSLKANEQIESQAVDYFNKKVKPIYSRLMVGLIKSKPEDILDYCTKWFRDKKGDKKQLLNMNSRKDQQSSDDSDHGCNFEMVSDQQFNKWRQERLQKSRKRRYGLSSEKASRGSIKVEKGQKKQENTYMRILFFCMNSFLFKNFTQRQIAELIEKMRREKYESDKEVCKEGEYGDRMYFVDEGIFQCYQETDKGLKSIKNYYVGDTFGEICLLHLMKRQASIISRSEGVLYSLDRESYIHFKKMCMNKKRTLYFCTLERHPLFSQFCQEKIQKICDVLLEAQYQEGEIVINEGDVGSKFYIIIDGILVAYKGKQQNIVQCYKQGDVFGEIALIKDTPRQASVKTLTRCRMVYMTRDVFRRIFENIDLLEKDIDQKYASKGNMINKRRMDNIQEQTFDNHSGAWAQKQNSSINYNSKSNH